MPKLAGLVRHAGVRVQDILVGLSGGALWIEGIFDHLGVRKHILDVFHSGEYLNTIMLALGWDDQTRARQRQRGVRGEVRARDWLAQYIPQTTPSNAWMEEARVSLRYLRARLDKMDYPDYRARGWPIGSGQIEGMNKHVIGSRMKGSGMRWSRPGASRMAAVRAQLLSRRPLAHFHHLRHHAFPSPPL